MSAIFPPTPDQSSGRRTEKLPCFRATRAVSNSLGSRAPSGACSKRETDSFSPMAKRGWVFFMFGFQFDGNDSATQLTGSVFGTNSRVLIARARPVLTGPQHP